MQNIASLTKHVNELEMKPDALPAVNPSLQSRAAGALAPEPDSEQSAGGKQQVPLRGLQCGNAGPLYTACFCGDLTSALCTLTQPPPRKRLCHTHEMHLGASRDDAGKAPWPLILVTRVLDPALPLVSL